MATASELDTIIADGSLACPNHRWPSPDSRQTELAVHFSMAMPAKVPLLHAVAGHLDCHQFRELALGNFIIAYLHPVNTLVEGIRMLRIHATFPSFPNGNLITVNGDFHNTPRLMILKSNGSKKWTLLKESRAFYMA